MEALRQEIRDEMKTLRINKKHVYGLLMRMVDEIDGGAPAPPPAPVKKAPAPAPVKKAEPAPVKKAEPAPAKKVVRKTTKKKAEVAAEPVLK
tara:strand:+ start:211 stop:486 length:276 start_codon:yes stop_codon:yes gene_type:complete